MPIDAVYLHKVPHTRALVATVLVVDCRYLPRDICNVKNYLLIEAFVYTSVLVGTKTTTADSLLDGVSCVPFTDSSTGRLLYAVAER